MADAPVVNLVYYTFETLFQPYVQGIELNALGERYIPMKKIWLDATPRVSLATQSRSRLLARIWYSPCVRPAA